MTAAMLVLEPIFEADLPDEQYAYRAGRNAQQAVREVQDVLYHGHREVVDADLSDYFGSIPHAELMLSLVQRIVDTRVRQVPGRQIASRFALPWYDRHPFLVQSSIFCLSHAH